MLISPWITCSDSDDAEIDEIMFKMKETAMNPGLKLTCQKDRLIKEFCRGLLHKLGTNNEQRRKDKDNIRAKLRAAGRLLISLNKKLEKELDMSAYINPKYFMSIVQTVKELGHATPNLTLTLGHYIKQICQLKRSLALQNDNEEEKVEAENFDIMYGAHWNNYVTSATLRRQKLRTLNKQTELPRRDDMIKLKEYLDKKISENLKIPKPSFHQWTEACQVLLVRILLFNKRRVAEVEELKVTDIVNIKNIKDNQDILSHMDITEKALATRMSVVEVRGKSTRGLRKVFVILSPEMLEACNHLIQTRMYVGIDSSHDYLFARPGGSAIDGCRAMREVTSMCPGLEAPELIRTRLLRKYLATTIQLLDMNGEELQMVADHMGHSVTVHTDVYRLQSSVLEKTKVARALIALENGQLNKFAGRNLTSIQNEELPMPLWEEEDYLDMPLPVDADKENDSDSESEKSIELETCNERINESNQNHIDEPVQKITTHKRKRWSSEEEAHIMAEFGHHIKEKRNPSASEIKTAQEKYSLLKERSAPMIRSKINNIILGKCKKTKHC